MKTVEELRTEEFNELKERYLHQLLDDGSMLEILGFTTEYLEDIPDDLVKCHYEGTLFSDDDFWCNQ